MSGGGKAGLFPSSRAGALTRFCSIAGEDESIGALLWLSNEQFQSSGLWLRQQLSGKAPGLNRSGSDAGDVMPLVLPELTPQSSVSSMDGSGDSKAVAAPPPAVVTTVPAAPSVFTPVGNGRSDFGWLFVTCKSEIKAIDLSADKPKPITLPYTLADSKTPALQRARGMCVCTESATTEMALRFSSPLAGAKALAAGAACDQPQQKDETGSDSSLLVLDSGSLLRLSFASGQLSSVSGTDTGVLYYEPRSVVCSTDGRYAYVSDTMGGRVRRVDMVSGAANTLWSTHIPQQMVWDTRSDALFVNCGLQVASLELPLDADTLRAALRCWSLDARLPAVLWSLVAEYATRSGSTAAVRDIIPRRQSSIAVTPCGLLIGFTILYDEREFVLVYPTKTAAKEEQVMTLYASPDVKNWNVRDMAVAVAERALYLVATENVIYRLDLSDLPELFVSPTFD